MTIKKGKRNGQITNANYKENVVNDQRAFERAFDFLCNCRIISSTLSDAPLTPNDADAYWVPAGATGWTQTECFAVWRTGVTTGTGNDPVAPFWEYYDPTQYGVNNGGLIIYEHSIDVWWYWYDDKKLYVLNPFGNNQSLTDFAFRSKTGVIGVQGLIVNQEWGIEHSSVGLGSAYEYLSEIDCGTFGLFKDYSEVDGYGYGLRKIYKTVGNTRDDLEYLEGLKVKQWDGTIYCGQRGIGIIAQYTANVPSASVIDLLPDGLNVDGLPTHPRITGFTPVQQIKISEAYLSNGSNSTSYRAQIILSGEAGATLEDGAMIKLSGGVDYVFASDYSRICLEVVCGANENNYPAVELWRNNL